LLVALKLSYFLRKLDQRLSIILKRVKKQKSSQDKRHNVLVDTLQPGTKVMVRNDDKLVKKLDARYRGPYQVVAITDT
jgi:hypothetical protein